MSDPRVEKVKANVTRNVKRMRSVLDAVRQGMGIPDRIRWRDRLSDFQKQRLRPQQQQGDPMPQIKERFMNRPRFLQSFFQPEQPQEPQFSPEDTRVLEEHRRQMLEDAERRKRAEEEEKAREEKRKNLEKAKARMAVENL